MRRISLLAVLMLLGALAASARTGAATTEVVMRGLDNPRGLSFAVTGALYVAEAGRGGSGPCVTMRGQPQCFGATGAVSRLWHGRQDRIATGLPSVISPQGEVTGPHDVIALGLGFARVAVGWGGDPALRAQLGPAGQSFGSLLDVAFGHVWRAADIADYESASNPAGGPVDSNPYGLLAGRFGSTYVADAGANALLQVSALGRVSAVTAFPPTARPAGCAPPFPAPPVSDPVPTAVASGADRALYVAELTGFPFCAGAARIWRVEPGRPPVVAADGFSKVIDIALDHGDMYVLEYDTAPFVFGAPGRLLRVGPDGSRTVITAALSHPTSIAVGPDGALYVSNKGDRVGEGEVLRIAP